MSTQTPKQAFLQSDQPHILMITNHGIHQWDIVPGLPDTGGQNVFVNQFTDTLAQFGFKITIINRGGYPHPVTGSMRTGVDYKDGQQRILYLEDDVKEFVRKEDMNEQTPKLASYLQGFLAAEGLTVDLIISHYWDAAKIGVLLNRSLQEPVKHIWVPHSLGAVKKRNMPPESWVDLRIDERIMVEKQTVKELDWVAATSSLIRQSLENDYGVEKLLFLPPCVKTERYYPREIKPDHPIWQFISDHCGLSASEVREHKVVAEISRTDRTKRKDVVIKAFAQAHEKHPQTLLAVSIDETEEELAAELNDLIDELGIRAKTAVLGYVWDELPDLYAITDVYCSPSVMEGFGMSVQEAAATKVPVVSSHLIPFVNEYLLGEEEKVDEVSFAGMEGAPLREGEGAIVVTADDVDGFATALERLLADDTYRREMGIKAYNITIPYFTWQDMAKRFLETSNVPMPVQA